MAHETSRKTCSEKESLKKVLSPSRVKPNSGYSRLSKNSSNPSKKKKLEHEAEERIQRIRNNRTKEERALDYLAGFLPALTGICSAVSIVDNEIFIAGNDLHAGTRDNNDHVLKLKKTVNYFLSLNTGKATLEEKKTVLSQIIKDHAVVATNKSPESAERYNAALGKLDTIIEDFLEDSSNYEDLLNYVKHFTIPEERNREEKSKDRYQVSLLTICEYAKKFIKEFASVEKYFTNNPAIKNAHILFFSEKDVHAEVKLALYLMMTGRVFLSADDTENKKDFYLGVSKLCCLSCWQYLDLFFAQLNKDKEKSEIFSGLTAGTHALAFNSWENPAANLVRGLDLGKALVLSAEGMEIKEDIKVPLEIKDKVNELLAQLAKFTTSLPSTPPRGAAKEYSKMSNSPKDYSPIKVLFPMDINKAPSLPSNHRYWEQKAGKNILKDHQGNILVYDINFVLEYMRKNNTVDLPPAHEVPLLSAASKVSAVSSVPTVEEAIPEKNIGSAAGLVDYLKSEELDLDLSDKTVSSSPSGKFGLFNFPLGNSPRPPALKKLDFEAAAVDKGIFSEQGASL